ncbi:hypothetical protein [Herbaspirillum rubrisubalbicans]|uniref:hypothetical protein n=1 Tax=Herbaspirillum rubrisubalbicans TaxID=80842 RepID=UPI0011BFBEBE|nr:hypothetical protein [Herbaspirillum rubrisubalbicans]
MFPSSSFQSPVSGLQTAYRPVHQLGEASIFLLFETKAFMCCKCAPAQVGSTPALLYTVYIYSIIDVSMRHTTEEMEPYPMPEDCNIPRGDGPGHGAGAMGRPPRRGILVTVRRLKKNGVNLSSRERQVSPLVLGELRIFAVQDRSVEFQSMAEVVSFEERLSSHLRFHPTRLIALLNPVIRLADERGMILYGIERLGGEGGPAVSYWQTWQIGFGIVEAGPPF